jgi:predicted kinase
MMVLVGGLPGSGKTYFAKRLASRIDAVWLSSDGVRNALKARGKYKIEDRLLVYTELSKLAELPLMESKNVIVDATFSRQNMRDLFISLAGKLSVPVHFIWVYANEELIKERLQHQREDSEADFTVYKTIRDQFEPLNLRFAKIESTNDNVESMLQIAEQFISGNDGT